MQLLISIAHIVGAIVALIALGIGFVFVASWEGDRNQRRALENAAMALGIAVEELSQPEHEAKIFRYMAERFSVELFKNRFSDFCGLIRTAWNWLGGLAVIVLLIGVIWGSFTERETAMYAWLALPLTLFFWIGSIVFSLACHLLTGRYPGESRVARKSLTKALQTSTNRMSS